MTRHFDDLTAIDCFFGELDEDTQNRLFQAWRRGSEVQCRGCNDVAWARVTVPAWSAVSYYRIKPMPLTKPSIDWSHVAKEYKWLTRDDDGTARIHREGPAQYISLFMSDGDVSSVAEIFASYTPGTCAWKDSLVERPGGQ